MRIVRGNNGGLIIIFHSVFLLQNSYSDQQSSDPKECTYRQSTPTAAVIGFYFAKELLSAGHSVTIMTVGDESSDKMKKLPFSPDLSSMLTSAVHNPEAACCNIFNCVSDRAVTLDGMAKLCAAAAGKTVEIVHYDPKAIGVDAKKAFPFRNMHFYAEPRAAKEILGWESRTNLPEDLKERFEEYVKIGRDKKEMKFELDDKILQALKTPPVAS